MQFAISTLLTLAPFALAAVHEVEVGASGQVFTPRTFSAAVGDIVIFKLSPNHDVAEGDFDKPCEPDDDGFYSGPYSGTDNGDKKFVINVTTDDPIYYYCAVQNHCQNGMVGGINIPSSGDETIDAYANAAKNARTKSPSSVSGGQLLSDQQISSLTASASSAPTASASGSSSPSGSAAATTPAASGSGSPSAAASASSTGAAEAVSAGNPYGIIAAALGYVALIL